MFVSKVNEIENIIFTEGILRIVAEDLSKPNVDELIESVKKEVLSRLNNERERVISSSVSSQIESSLKNFNTKSIGKENIRASLSHLVESIDVESAYDRESKRISEIIVNKNYEQAIKVYDCKGLVYSVSQIFKLRDDGYLEHIKNLLSHKKYPLLNDELRKSFPLISIEQRQI